MHRNQLKRKPQARKYDRQEGLFPVQRLRSLNGKETTNDERVQYKSSNDYDDVAEV